MKRKNLILTMLSIFAFMFVFGVKVDAAAVPVQITATGTIEDSGYTYYSEAGYDDGRGYRTSRYKMTIKYSDNDSIRTSVGLCLKPNAVGPLDSHSTYNWGENATGSNSRVEILDNSQIARIMYYGLCVNGCEVDAANYIYKKNHGTNISDAARTVLVHVAASKINLQNHDPNEWKMGLNSAGQRDAEELIEYVGTLPEPDGYFLYRAGDGNVQTIGVIATRQRQVEITKTSTPEDKQQAQEKGYSLAGAKYRIYKDSSCTERAYMNGAYVDDLTTDASGDTGTVILLQGKTYYVKELSAPTGFQKDYTCHVCDLKTSTTCNVQSIDRLIQEDNPSYGKLIINKTSSNPTLTNNNSNYSLDNAIFTVYSVSNLSSVTSYSTCTGTVLGTLHVDNGVARMNNIPVGNYCVKETSAGAKNFALNETFYKTFSITDGASEADLTKEYTCENTPITLKGKFTIKKSSTDSSVIIDGENYKLTGAKFAIYSGNTCSSNAQIRTVEINSGNTVTISDLEYGTYAFKEIVAPKGFNINNNCQTVTIGSTSPTKEVKDSPKKGTITVYKEGSDDAEWSLEGAEYELYEGTTCTGNSKGTFHIKADGSTDDVIDVNFGKYSIQETKAPSNNKYELNDYCYTVEVREKTESDTTDTEHVMKTVTEETKDGYGRIIKVSTTKTDKSLEGGTFILCKTEEECKKDKPKVECCELEDGQTEADRVCALVTDKKGVTNTCKLKPGVYYYKETKAPAGFEVNPTVRSITVEPGAKVEDECPENLIPENPKTGIENPIMIAIAAVAIGGAGLYLNRRKNAFRQV